MEISAGEPGHAAALTVAPVAPAVRRLPVVREYRTHLDRGDREILTVADTLRAGVQEADDLLIG